MKHMNSLRIPFTDTELLDSLVRASKFYWKTRKQQATRQKQKGKRDAGTRGQVTGGKHLDGFANLIRDIGRSAGYDDSEIFFNTAVPIPGYYRPQKNWDVVFLRNGRLIAAVELKSQSGSFGNNFNNRSEEVVGISRDFWIAYREKAFGVGEAPWLGYFFFLEDSDSSSKPVALAESPLPPMAIFKDASYQRRYEILCERLMLERDFNATALLISRKEDASVRDGGPNVTALAFLKSLYAHLILRA